MKGSCFVYFRSASTDLDAASRALAGYGLTVKREGDELVVGRPESPEFRVKRVVGEDVQAKAAEIGEGTEYEAEMRACDARFEIGFDDLDETLDEINTLMEVQGALQDASDGYLFLPWNGNLTEPWRD